MDRSIIHSGRIVTPSGILDGGYIAISGGLIAEIAEGFPPSSGPAIDASGLWVLPGFIDVHCHGGGGRSFQEPDAETVHAVLRTHARGGTTSIVPAIAACPQNERHACLEALRTGRSVGRNSSSDKPSSPSEGPNAQHPARRSSPLPRGEGLGESALPEILGAYIEGPYFSEKERGAQPLDLIGPPDPDDYLPTLREFGDFIKVWSFAPEFPGSLDFITRLREHGVVAALGHSDASDDAVARAVDAGAGLVTHIYCAQSTFHRVEADKRLGLAEMALLLDALTVEVIADGKHVPPYLLQLVLKNKPPDQVCLITDAMPAAGMPPGEYTFLGDTVWVTDEVAYRADRQRYAGSVLTMARAVATVHRLAAVPMPALSEMASLTPARTIGVADRKGSLEPGKDADIVLLDDDLEVRMTIARGRVVCGGNENEKT